MERWHDTAGIPWLHRDLADPDAESADYGQHLAGIALGRGYAHQMIPGLGLATTAAGVLLRELARPVEVGGGRVLELGVQVDVDLQHTLVLLQGSAEALRAGLSRLEGLLLDPSYADLSAPPGRPGHPWAGLGRELAAWFGAGAGPLSTEIDPARADEPELLAQAIGALHPSRGVPAVAVTTRADLVGSALADPADRTAGPPGALVWRDRGPGSLRRGNPATLLSMRADRSSGGWAAQRVLTETLGESVRVRGAATGATGLRPVGVTVGSTRLVAAYATPSEQGLVPAVLHESVLQAVEASRELAPARLDELLGLLREPGNHGGRTHPVTLAVESLLSGAREVSGDLQREMDEVGVGDVRRELDVLLDRVLLGLPTDATEPPGFPAIDLAVAPAAPDAPRRPVSVHQARIRTRAGESSYVLTKVERRGDRVAAHGRPEAGHRRPEQVLDAVTLPTVVARIDRGEDLTRGHTTLVDADDHRVMVPWYVLKWARSLRKQLDRDVPADRTLVLPEQQVWADSMGRVRRRGRRIVVAVAVFLAVVAAALVAIVTLTGESSDPSTVVAVGAGEQAELSNGTTMRVGPLETTDEPGSIDGTEVRTAEARLCGGGLTTSDGRETEGRNYFDTSRFSLDGVPGEIDDVLVDGTEPIGMLTLADDECVDVVLAFDVPPDQTETGVGVVYTNALGDQVTWR